MFNNYILITWRHILNNKVYSSINILGLVVGLSVYLFGSLLAEYEQTHDAFFENSDRIFTVGTVFPNTDLAGIIALDSVHSAVGPLISEELSELEYLARSISREYLVSVDNKDYYQKMFFVDPDFSKIFDFKYIEGDESALSNPTGLMITRSAAFKYFGEGSALGKTVELDHDKVLSVTAVVEDLPANSHFNSSLVNPNQFELVAHVSVLNTEEQNEEEGNYDSLNLGDLTYMLFPAEVDIVSIQTKVDGFFDSHYPDQYKEVVAGFKVHELSEANTFIWSATGLPIIESIQLLAVLVLIIAIVNYTNLATAQSLRRTREVGLRKTMGAERTQLLIQFLVESVLVAVVSMLIALGMLELLVPVFNAAIGKSLVINYADTVVWLLCTTVLVGLIAGAYPAYLITLTRPIDTLRDGVLKSTGGNFFRSAMLGLQFAISIFMLAIVVVVYLQNQKLEESGNIYPRSQIVTLDRLYLPEIQSQLDVLQHEVQAIAGVTSVSFSSQVPFQQSNSSFMVSAIMGDEENGVMPNIVWMSPEFLATYNIDILAGRALNRGTANDTIRDDVYSANVVVNQTLLKILGYTMNATGQVFHDLVEDETARTYTIVGVVPDQNFLGFHNQIKPMIFAMAPENYSIASVKIEGRGLQAVIADIEKTWDKIIPNYPIQAGFLNDKFNDVFNIFSAMSQALMGFSAIAMILSMVGLFGLAAFMVERRTREIGLRKVMGASLPQIVRLLIWQFSKPVLIASVGALPLAYLASNMYLTFFSDRLALPVLSIIVSGFIGVLLSWCVVSVHAFRVARENPIYALHYE